MAGPTRQDLLTWQKSAESSFLSSYHITVLNIVYCLFLSDLLKNN